jgi:SAM-dependent methyltransferase
MSTRFYNKVARKFGAYHTPAKYIQRFSGDAPEGVFKAKLIEISSPQKVALDVGCADGRFALSVARYFKKIYAIDLSEGMLASANKFKKVEKVTNVDFLRMDAAKTTFPDSNFDVIYDRRGPTYYEEFYRLLKDGGYYLEIGIGEKDTQDIQKIFGRGQNYGKWNDPRFKETVRELKKAGFTILYKGEFTYDEFYSTYKDLDIFLQGVPIFPDFDSEKDKKLLEKYTKAFTKPDGIWMGRHRIVILAQKP